MGLAHVSLISATPHPKLPPMACPWPAHGLARRPFDLILTSIRCAAPLLLYPPTSLIQQLGLHVADCSKLPSLRHAELRVSCSGSFVAGCPARSVKPHPLRPEAATSVG